MKTPIPENTSPMMIGDDPFGGVEMGGMFTVVKMRKDQTRGDYTDPARAASGMYGMPPSFNEQGLPVRMLVQSGLRSCRASLMWQPVWSYTDWCPARCRPLLGPILR